MSKIQLLKKVYLCGHIHTKSPPLSRYASSVAAPYLWDFNHLDLDGWILEVGEMLLSEEPPSWLGILAKSSLVSECVERACVRWRLHVFAINLEFFSPYTLGFSHGGVRDNLTYYVHLKRELELLQGFDSLPSLWRCVVYVCFCHVLVVFVSGGWYSSSSDTWSLFTRQHNYCHPKFIKFDSSSSSSYSPHWMPWLPKCLSPASKGSIASLKPKSRSFDRPPTREPNQFSSSLKFFRSMIISFYPPSYS